MIESKWSDRMRNTTLYLYGFETKNFVLQDEIVGCYVAKTAQIPKATYTLDDLFSAPVKRNVEIRVVDCLWDLADQIKMSALNRSL